MGESFLHRYFRRGRFEELGDSIMFGVIQQLTVGGNLVVVTSTVVAATSLQTLRRSVSLRSLNKLLV